MVRLALAFITGLTLFAVAGLQQPAGTLHTGKAFRFNKVKEGVYHAVGTGALSVVGVWTEVGRLKQQGVSAEDAARQADLTKHREHFPTIQGPGVPLIAATRIYTAEGRVVQSRAFFEGKEIQNLTLTFVRGKLVSMTGSGSGFDGLKALYDAAGDGKDIFAFVDLGINPQITLPSDSKIGTWVPAGMITVGIGNNAWAGGDNRVSYGYTAFLPGSTVTLDGKTIIANGQLQI